MSFGLSVSGNPDESPGLRRFEALASHTEAQTFYSPRAAGCPARTEGLAWKLPISLNAVVVALFLVGGASWAQTPLGTNAALPGPAQGRSDWYASAVSVSVDGRSLGRIPLLLRSDILYLPLDFVETHALHRRRQAPTLSLYEKTWVAAASIVGIQSDLQFEPLALSLQTPNGSAQAARGARADSASADTAALEEKGLRGVRAVPTEVLINGAASGVWPMLAAQDRWYAVADALKAWRIKDFESLPTRSHRNLVWYALSSVPGYIAEIRADDQALSLQFAPSAFLPTAFARAESKAAGALSPSLPAVYLNYDVNATTTKFGTAQGGTRSGQVGVLGDLGLSGPWGLLTTGFTAQQLTERESSSFRSQRLETTYSVDWPERQLSLRVGDGQSKAGLGGRGVQFGGVQLSSNFDLTPGFQSQPIPVIGGTALGPSTVELFVNNALRQTLRVPSGPFSITDSQLVSGPGDVRVVVRDVLGREQVFNRSFFQHSELLQPGLSEWSAELGRLRLGLGSIGSSYGDAFGSAMLRMGLTERLTAETSVQWSSQVKNLSLGAVTALPWQALLTASATWSQNQPTTSSLTSQGVSLGMGVEWPGDRQSLSLRAQASSSGFQEFGAAQLRTDGGVRHQWGASYGYQAPGGASYSIALASVTEPIRGRVSTLSLSASKALAAKTSVSWNATRILSSRSESATSVGLSINVALDDGVSHSASLSDRDGVLEGVFSLTGSSLGGQGSGWRLTGNHRQGLAGLDAGLWTNQTRWSGALDVTGSSVQRALRLGFQSAFAWVGGQPLVTRKVENSLGLIELPGYGNIRIHLPGGQTVRTNAAGFALASNLLPYQRNAVQVNATDLPMSAELDDFEQVVVPRLKHAVSIKFAVRQGVAALLKILQSDGSEFATGTSVTLKSDGKEFFIGRRSEAYITGLAGQQELVVASPVGPCSVKVSTPPSSAAAEQPTLLRLGPLTCEKLTP